jgi:hypothetical protein
MTGKRRPKPHTGKVPVPILSAASDLEEWLRRDMIWRLRRGGRARYAVRARAELLARLHDFLGVT